MIRVLVAEGHPASREDLRAVLALDREVQVVGETLDGRSTLELGRKLHPDLLFVDGSVPGMGGLDAGALSSELPETGIVFLPPDPAPHEAWLGAPAGRVAKDATSDELLHAIRTAVSATATRQRFGWIPAAWRRPIEILLESGTIAEDQVDAALAEYCREESLADTFISGGLTTQRELTESLERARVAPLLSLSPYPELGAAIAPTEARLSSAHLVDPVDPIAARRLPIELGRSLGVVIIATSGEEGVVAMADPLDEGALAEAERRTQLRLFRVAAPAEHVQDALLRAWTGAGTGPVLAIPDPSLWSTAVFAAISAGLFAALAFALRGEPLDAIGSVVVSDPWLRMGELRLPAEQQPFISVHVALYNEARVVDRLLAACTSFDYKSYEVIVVDDSTDETTALLERWKSSQVRVIHRPSRKGFKGGALQEALRRMNPRTEYVLIFDADFVPPADAIWHFLDYFGRLGRPRNGNGQDVSNGNGHTVGGVPQNGDRLAAVQGYQWHMLNASENWITKGVRAEFAGSYVLERTGQELFGAMKMISGSVYMIRADVLRRLGWATSITEDWELTIRLYLAGYKVLYTPYIQAPAECVSTVQRLIKQRMRWAEGHTYNVKKYFFQVISSPNLSFKEKLEFCFYAPYYLQSVLFSFGTVTWLLGTFVFHQKLPMWGEVFGWSLILSNTLALPLMNLAGVLLEGSLRRDAFGVLSVIGLSWLLVPFQTYASLKSLFERKEGGWVRTPKSGRVTEALGRFRLARLMPWEMPKRRRDTPKKPSRLAQFGLAAAAVVVATGIITVGALSVRAVAQSDGLNEQTVMVPAVLGTVVPLGVLALGWLRLRRRFTALALAFTLGLGTNVAFLAHAVPAQAVTDNTSVFTFARTTGYSSPMSDMKQGYSPSGAQAFCPTTYGSGGGGYSWTCRYASDVFSAGQTLSAGNATADLYLENDNPTPTLVAASGFGAGSASSIAIPKPTGVASGDVLIATISVRGGTNNGAITKPSASWNLIDRIDSLTSITLAVYSLVAGGSEPASYTWSWSTGNQKSAGGIQAFRGVDTVTPIDDHAGQSETTGSSTHIAPSVNTTYGNALRVVAFADSTNFICSTPWDFQLDVVATSTGGGAGSTDATNNAAHSFRLLPPGATGTVTGSCGNNDIGATAQLTLRSAAGASRTCTLTARLKLLTTIQPGATTTAVLNSGLSLSVNVPAGAATGDVLVATVGKTGSEFLGTPSGWTRVQHVGDSSTMDFGVFYHVAAGGDPSSYAFSWTGSTNRYAAGGMTAYSNVDNDNPVDLNGTWGSGASSVTSFPAPSITTTAANEMIVTAYGVAANNPNWTAPTGMTERVDQVAGTGSTYVSVAHDDVLQSGPPAATGTKTGTSNVAGGGGAIILALRPGKTLGSGTAQVIGPTAATLVSTTFATTAVTFAAGDQLELEVIAPNDSANCATWLSYDGGSQPSKLTVATVVPEGVAGP